MDKPLVWMHGEVKSPPFSAQARIEAGTLLRQLQGGQILALPHSRPMSAIGTRCHELRIQDANATWRIVYRLDADAVIIIEVFSKNPRDTERRAGRLPAPSQGVRPGDSQGTWTMKHTKRVRLEAHGWRVGSAQEFLGLSAEEAALVETKLRLSRAVRERRAKLSQSQAALAKRLHSSQSRVAKMEAADPTVSVDLLLKALFALGATPRDVATAIRTPLSSAA